MKKVIFIALAFGLLSLSAMAQNQKPAELTNKPVVEEMTATQVLNAFYSNWNAYFTSSAPNLESLGKYLSSDFIFIRNSETVDGKVQTLRGSAEDMLRDIKGTRDSKLRADRKIISVTFNQTVSHLANISAVIALNYYQDTTLVAEVKAYTSHSMVNENGVWKIKNMSTDRVAEQQIFGVCPCRITRTNADKSDMFSAKVMYPSGNSFESEELAISFRGKGATSIVTVGSNYYIWKENIVYAVKKDGDKTSQEIVGKANNNIEVITLILSKNIFKSQCLRFEPLK